MKGKSLFVIAALFIGACGTKRDGIVTPGPTKSGPPERPIVTPSLATVRVGDSLAFHVATPQNPTLWVAARWAAVNRAVVDIESTTGMARARAAGVTTVTAAPLSNENQVGAAILNVVP
jgi:hypothetical protein